MGGRVDPGIFAFRYGLARSCPSCTRWSGWSWLTSPTGPRVMRRWPWPSWRPRRRRPGTEGLLQFVTVGIIVLLVVVYLGNRRESAAGADPPTEPVRGSPPRRTRHLAAFVASRTSLRTSIVTTFLAWHRAYPYSSLGSSLLASAPSLADGPCARSVESRAAPRVRRSSSGRRDVYVLA